MYTRLHEILGTPRHAGIDEESRVVLPAARFLRVLRRERMRSDRTGLHFAVVLVAPHANRTAAFDELARVLADRLRETDVAGYLDDERLGVLLPDTDLAGAERLAAELLRDLDHGQCLDYEVLVYPGLQILPGPPPAASPEQAPQGDTTQRAVESLLVEALPPGKRLLDVFASVAGLILLSPLLAATAILVKGTSPGPILFRQWRTGLGGRPFLVYKFRTMCADAEEQKEMLMRHNEQDGPAFKIKDDPRVTPLGRFLRRTCIDELPQLWNVLRGDMTLVGPRPLPCHEAAACHSWERRRLDVTPGLTCFWQVSGTRNDFAEWMRLDIRYVNQRHLSVDAYLLWRTFIKVVLQRASC